MSTNLTSIDITTLKPSDLVRLVEEVEITKTPRQLKRNNKTVAVLMPLTQTTPKKKRKTSIEDALALAGAWKDIPADDMEERLDRIRHESKPTPPFTLDD